MRVNWKLETGVAGTALVLAAWSAAAADGLSPAEALRHMRVPAGFSVKLFASEPEIRQPVAMYFDERGRTWVIQYLQYPTPAGLQPVQVDQYLRTQYDRRPEPPPRGPRGADRITICEDTDGDGRADRFTDFAGGLNLATGLAIGHGGLFVAQSPYLLFYPDRNHDDVPDGDPEVLLTGFGMEDAHAFPNSLQWGPDGWLYGAQGSTVTANIRGIEFQQGIWRYHPLTKEFELFAEGGGNTWGVDFDEHGNLIAGTNFGDQIALHQVQGGYYVKGFSKHGPLHNPYTFGYFEHLPYKNFKGGHVTSGGIVYQGGAFPEKYRGQYLAANVLANAVYWHTLERDGSSFTGQFGGELLTTDDTWFRPVDCDVAPDGSVLVADWYDRRATHLDPQDSWDRSNGRIYQIVADGTQPVAPFNLRNASNAELVKLLAHPNRWFAREARRLLAERRDPQVWPALRKLVLTGTDDPLALQALWALHVCGGLDEATARQTLAHRSEDVRTWTVRLLGDRRRLSPAWLPKLVALAASEPSAVVRNQLACSVKRLPGEQALPILRELLNHDEDARDPQIPLLLWWALESKAVSDRAGVLALFDSPALWRKPLAQQFLLERLARRYAAEGTDAGFVACARLLAQAPGTAETELLVRGLEAALGGRRLERVPAPLEPWLARAWKSGPPSLSLLRLALRLGSAPAQSVALGRIADPNVAEQERLSLIEVIGQTGPPESVPILLTLSETTTSKPLQRAALTALQSFPNPEIAPVIVQRYAGFDGELRRRAVAVLVSRPAWSRTLVQAVADGRLDARDISFEQLRQMTRHQDAALTALVAQRWGKVQPESPADKRSRINELKLLLSPSGAAGRVSSGDPVAGRQVFVNTCAPCHNLFGEGGNLGPVLTGADRKNLDLLLASIVTPSAYIRPEYVSYDAVTHDDQSFSGLLVESTPAAVTLADRTGQRTVLDRARLQSLRESTVSLMPEGLLEALTQTQIIDLFRYLQSDGPAAAK